MTISFIVPSINRPTLYRTISSIEVRHGDEILLELDIPKSGKWGNPQRNKAIERAKGDYLAFIDDDDYYVRGHRGLMAQAILENPNKPILFRMQYPDGRVIWDKQEVVPGNVSTQMILVPNQRDMLYYWKDGRNMADFIFIDNWKWPKEDIVWREEIISLLGNNDGEAIHHE